MNPYSCLRLRPTFYDHGVDFTGLTLYSCSMNSERTQITRKTTSAPMRWIIKNVEFSPFENVLHFGEGRAFEDSHALAHGGPLVKAFDPNSPHVWKRDVAILDQEYDVGVSVYVFNALEPMARRQAFLDMLGCCENLIVAVRTDKVEGKKPLGMDGVVTKRNTFQTQLSADAWREWFLRMSPEGTSVEVLHKTSAYVILSVKR